MSRAEGVLGIGNAIVDVLAHTDDAFLARHELAKGTMTLIGAERFFRNEQRRARRTNGQSDPHEHAW